MDKVDKKVDKLPNVDVAHTDTVPLYVSHRNPSVSQPTGKKTKSNAIFAIIIILAVAYIGRNDIANLADIDLVPEETLALAPADVQLYTFSDPFDNDSVNVEFWLINIGEETATDIEVFIRVRNHNGTILFSEIVDTTALLLREDETCSGMYIVEYDDAEYLTHTVELSWLEGRNSYSKTTILA